MRTYSDQLSTRLIAVGLLDGQQFTNMVEMGVWGKEFTLDGGNGSLGQGVYTRQVHLPREDNFQKAGFRLLHVHYVVALN